MALKKGLKTYGRVLHQWPPATVSKGSRPLKPRASRHQQGSTNKNGLVVGPPRQERLGNVWKRILEKMGYWSDTAGFLLCFPSKQSYILPNALISQLLLHGYRICGVQLSADHRTSANFEAHPPQPCPKSLQFSFEWLQKSSNHLCIWDQPTPSSRGSHRPSTKET